MEIPSDYFVDIKKLILKCYGEAKHLEYLILKKKNKVKKLTLLDFKTYCKVIIVKTALYWQNNTQIDHYISVLKQEPRYKQ